MTYQELINAIQLLNKASDNIADKLSEYTVCDAQPEFGCDFDRIMFEFSHSYGDDYSYFTIMENNPLHMELINRILNEEDYLDVLDRIKNEIDEEECQRLETRRLQKEAENKEAELRRQEQERLTYARLKEKYGDAL